MSIKDQVTTDMKTAMLAKDEARLSALRMIKAEFMKAEKEKNLTLDNAREISILQTMVKQRRDSITQFEQGNRPELAAKEKSELDVLTQYLPEQMSEAEVTAIIDNALAELGTPDPKQMGKVMGQVMGKLKAAGKPFDAQAANALVRARLGA